MKLFCLVIVTSFLMPLASIADEGGCDKAVKAAYRKSLRVRGVELTSFAADTNGSAIDEVNQSEELSSREKRNAVLLLSRKKNIAYRAFIDYRGGSGAETIIVEKATCEIISEVLTYAE